MVVFRGKPTSGRDAATGQFVSGYSSPLAIQKPHRGSNTEAFKRFSAETRAIANDLIPRSALAYQKKLAREALKRIIRKTPVDYGLARNNWILTVGKPSNMVYKRDDPTGRLAMDRAEKALKKMRAYQTIHIVNNLPYINVLEYGLFDPPDPGPSKDKRPHRFGRVWVKGGYSVQAPKGMIGVTYAELVALFK